MRRIACALALASSAATAAPLEIHEVAHGVFVHEGATLALDAPGHDDIANIGFVVGERCVAVIDTGGSVRTGRALREAIASRTKVRICYVINTHVHVDHVLGNAAFKADQPAFVGSASLGSGVGVGAGPGRPLSGTTLQPARKTVSKAMVMPRLVSANMLAASSLCGPQGGA